VITSTCWPFPAETVLRHFQLALRQLLALSATATCSFVESRFSNDARRSLQCRGADRNLIVDALHAAGQLLGFTIAIAVEECEIDLSLHQAGGLNAPDAAPISPMFPLMLSFG